MQKLPRLAPRVPASDGACFGPLSCDWHRNDVCTPAAPTTNTSVREIASITPGGDDNSINDVSDLLAKLTASIEATGTPAPAEKALAKKAPAKRAPKKAVA